MIDVLSAIIGLLWGAALLVLLIKRSNPLGIGIGFYLLSLYSADRILPRVLVDAWPNFDAGRTPALRPILIFPDLLLVTLLVLWVRSVSWRALLMSGLLVFATAAGLLAALLNSDIPTGAALFWTTAPLRGVGVILLVDEGVRRLGWARARQTVIRFVAFGAGLLALQLLAVFAAEWVASWLGYDLANIWSGFAWTRPNIPGWNNNIAASAVALGASAAILLPDALSISQRWRFVLVALGAGALLAAEYRTAIITMALALGLRLASWSYPSLRRAAPPMYAVTGSALVMMLVTSALLGLAAQAVPRLADLNPLTYALQIAGPTPGTTPLPSASATAAPSRVADPDAVGDANGDTSTTSRAEIVRAALSVWGRDPLVGDGSGAWEFSRPTSPSFLQKAITPHNGYAWVLADFGILGLTAFFGTVVLLILLARPSVAVAGLVILALLLEVAIVGVAHSRYAVFYWALLGIAALADGADVARSGEPAPR